MSAVSPRSSSNGSSASRAAAAYPVAREGYDPVFGARPLKRDGGLDVRVREVRPSGRAAAAVA